MNRTTCVASSAMAALLSTVLTAQAEGLDEIRDFNIAAQPLDAALIEFSEQAGLQLMVPTELVVDLQSPGIEGEVSTTTALASLLDGNGLMFQPIGDDTVVLSRTSDDKTLGKSQPTSSQVLIAQNQTSEQQAQMSRAKSMGINDAERENARPLEEIVVTGTNIRGSRSAAPIVTFSREQIDATGLATAGELLERLPQNFGGGLTEDTVELQTDDSGFNQTNGTGVNLRGLGTDSTLILLNGRRLAPTGVGTFVDVSMIPIAAIERVEILTDGASAIYGADAVGGVVNFVLREQYEGAETRVRYSPDFGSDFEDVRISQSLGSRWDSGSLLLTYEFYSRDNLDVSDRDFTSEIPSPSDILPEQDRHALVVFGQQELTDRSSAFGQALIANRDTSRTTVFPDVGGPGVDRRDTLDGSIDQIAGTIGSIIDIGQVWQTEVAVSYANDKSDQDTIRSDAPDIVRTNEIESDVWSIDLKADGDIGSLPGGKLKLAVGGSYREESLDWSSRRSDGLVVLDVNQSRTVSAVFAEAFLPLFGRGNERKGLERLELTLAARFEDFSDTESSTTPKVGMLWSPATGLNLRATFGESFRAPLLREIRSGFSATLVGLPDPFSPTGTSITALLVGSNPDLDPEEATTWTAGFDYSPPAFPDFEISATYFDIEFENRIARGATGSELFASVLSNPDRFGILTDRSPDQAFLTLLENLPLASNFTSFPGFGPPSQFADTDVVIDGRLRNFAIQDISGIDLKINYGFETNAGVFDIGLAGTYLLKIEEALLSTIPRVDVVDTVLNPIDFRLRASVSWAHRGFGSSLFVNFQDEYDDNLNDPNGTIESWTTADLQIRYEFAGEEDSGWLRGLTASLSVINVTDEDPPFFEDRALPLGLGNYDPTNATPIGRTFSFQLSKAW